MVEEYAEVLSAMAVLIVILLICIGFEIGLWWSERKTFQGKQR